ncbi:MAG: DUF58 domain-containing protein [Nitrospirae bacterium]|nr:DUF58 domain-containing protein [Nitrospirota bacterium]
MGNRTINPRPGAGPGIIRITKAGGLYIALTIFLGFAAVNTGNNLIFLIVSAFLSFMGISGFFGKRNLSKISLDVELPEEIYARAGFPLKVILANERRFLPAFLIRVHLPGHEVLFPFVDPGTKTFRRLPVSFDERGRTRIADISISSVFPFNFFVRSRKMPQAFEAIVLPEPRKADLHSLFERERRSRGEESTDKAGYEADIISVRDYIKGDPLKYVHWKASAKTGRLKIKELSSLSRQPVTIDFDAVPIRDPEERISSVTYVLLKLFKQNIPVGLRIGGVLYKPLTAAHAERAKSHRLTLLRKLALYDKE